MLPTPTAIRDQTHDRRKSESLVVVPGLFSHPLEADARLRADLDGGRLGSCHGLLHRLHQVLRVPHQHLRRLNVLVRACNGKVVQRLLSKGRD